MRLNICSCYLRSLRRTHTQSALSKFITLLPSTRVSRTYSTRASRKVNHVSFQSPRFKTSNLELISSISRAYSLQTSQRLEHIPDYPVRVRFAPSPTGNLHLGSLRTAIFNYLIARRTGGSFILRVEDTDSKRTVKGAEERLIQDLQWAGLTIDEGPGVGANGKEKGEYGPYKQSQRAQLYAEHAYSLVETGDAYRCFCSEEDLLAKASERAAQGEIAAAEYDGTCLRDVAPAESSQRAAAGEAFVVRLKDPHRNIQAMKPWRDRVHGLIKPRRDAAKRRGAREAWDDSVLLKRDGQATYHLANVVDDHLMQITDVIRGVEWLESTWKHLAIYSALGWKAPRFAHVGLLLDETGAKLSKRDEKWDLNELQTQVLPSALVNFLVLLGWSMPGEKSGKGSQYASMENLEGNFSLSLNKTNPIVDLEKLWHIQKLHANAAIADGNSQNYHLIRNLTIAAAKKMFPISDETRKVGIVLETDMERRIDQLLDTKIDWIGPKHFLERLEYLFKSATAPTFNPSRPLWKEGFWTSDTTEHLYEEFNLTVAIQMLHKLTHLQLDNQSSTQPLKVIQTRVKSILNETIDHIRDSNLQWPQGIISEADCNGLISKVIRRWITGGAAGPSIVQIIAILGPKVSEQRILEAFSNNWVQYGDFGTPERLKHALSKFEYSREKQLLWQSLESLEERKAQVAQSSSH